MAIRVNVYTLPETNIAPENWPSQKEIHLRSNCFSGATLVSGRVTIGTIKFIMSVGEGFRDKSS